MQSVSCLCSRKIKNISWQCSRKVKIVSWQCSWKIKWISLQSSRIFKNISWQCSWKWRIFLDSVGNVDAQFPGFSSPTWNLFPFFSQEEDQRDTFCLVDCARCLIYVKGIRHARKIRAHCPHTAHYTHCSHTTHYTYTHSTLHTQHTHPTQHTAHTAHYTNSTLHTLPTQHTTHTAHYTHCPHTAQHITHYTYSTLHITHTAHYTLHTQPTTHYTYSPHSTLNTAHTQHNNTQCTVLLYVNYNELQITPHSQQRYVQHKTQILIVQQYTTGLQHLTPCTASKDMFSTKHRYC